MTSSEYSLTWAGRSTLRCSSLAVVMPSSGYLNSNHHCLPVASITIESSGGVSVVSAMTCHVGTSMMSTMATGMMVHSTSRRVLP